MTRPMTVTELVTRSPGSYDRLCGQFGPEMVARLLDLERDMQALLERELPEANADERTMQAAHLAHAIATDGPWFSAITQERPGKVAKTLRKAHRAARDLLKALDELPPAGVYGVHMRLLLLDLPSPAMRQVLHGELVYQTIGKVDAGLNRRKTGVAEIALAAMQTHDGTPLREVKSQPEPLGNKPRAARLARSVGDAFENAGAPVTVSGTGEGAYPRAVAAVLEAAGLRDASAVDVARREAERRRAALHSGGNAPQPAKISTGPAGEM